ncbi:YkgJ family cysteine cluster protein [Halomonas sp. BM-2019]|uniref:YkgJ family cysteine cluster protein n=1 Tax=Halomonas sp. BM-2019 TaxID=2811227 RepID=UPI001B3C1B26|nr:MAG: YkgJ family cysteine cluster protein [Halomonas sp. BM-2019]
MSRREAAARTAIERSEYHPKAAEGECRPGCGACCIAPSINSPIPGMPQGKPAGVRCVQLDAQNLCRLFGDSRRPALCERFQFEAALCGGNRDEALARIDALEIATGVTEE